MNKKVLIISSSPRKNGNSDLLCDEFLKGALEAGHKAKKISLCDKKIKCCKACDVCQKGKPCVIDDDMEKILQKMIGADVIVLATPVYFYTMSAQLKTLIDRTYAQYIEIIDKEFYFILTAADEEERNMQRAIESLRAFTFCLTGAKEKGIICATGIWKKGDVKDSKYMKMAFERGVGI